MRFYASNFGLSFQTTVDLLGIGMPCCQYMPIPPFFGLVHSIIVDVPLDYKAVQYPDETSGTVDFHMVSFTIIYSYNNYMLYGLCTASLPPFCVFSFLLNHLYIYSLLDCKKSPQNWPPTIQGFLAFGGNFHPLPKA